MEELNNKKLNNPESLPEVNQEIKPEDLPRLPDGKIDIEKIAIRKDEKNNYIVPDNIFDTYFRELPKGTKNSSGTWRAANNGKIKILGVDPADSYIHRLGAEASNAAQAQRRTSREILEDLTRKKAKIEDIERLGLEESASNLEAANYAQIRKAIQGDTKAMEYIRDTMGEKPTEKLDASVTALTPEDKELLKNVEDRLKNDDSE